jgi:hypothetical protein
MIGTILEKIIDGIRDFFTAVHEINEKYKEPRIKMTRMVSISLLMLRLYLIGMIFLLAYKFVSTVF